jgi:hypothetical protein
MDTGSIIMIIETNNYFSMNDSGKGKPAWVQAVQSKMNRLNLKQHDLLPVLKVKTRGAVGHYFTGRNELSVTQMRDLCEFLELDMVNLISGENMQESVNELKQEYNKVNCKYHNASANCQRIFDKVLDLDKRGLIDTNYTKSLITLLSVN